MLNYICQLNKDSRKNPQYLDITPIIVNTKNCFILPHNYVGQFLFVCLQDNFKAGLIEFKQVHHSCYGPPSIKTLEGKEELLASIHPPTLMISVHTTVFYLLVNRFTTIMSCDFIIRLMPQFHLSRYHIIAMHVLVFALV